MPRVAVDNTVLFIFGIQRDFSLRTSFIVHSISATLLGKVVLFAVSEHL